MRRLLGSFLTCRAQLLALLIAAAIVALPAAGRAECGGDCNGDGNVTINELIIMVNIVLGNAQSSACPFGIGAGVPVSVPNIVAAVNNLLNGCPATPTPSATLTITATPTNADTATITPTPTITPTLGPLGTRHFVLNKTKSTFQAALGPGLTLTLGGFQGQTNGVTENAFFDMQAGQPDANGFATIDITASSEYLFVDATALAQLVLCIKPMVPVTAAGVIGCNGGVDYSTVLTQDHNIGQVGIDGFTPADCNAAHGQLEDPHEVCTTGLAGEPCASNSDCDTTTGAGDGSCGVGMATCTAPGGSSGRACQNDSNCDSTPGAADGTCGTTVLGGTPGVCNGPFQVSQVGGDTGPGELLIAPFSAQGFSINGLPAELKIESALPCGDEGPGDPITFAFTSGISRSTILNFSNMPDQTLTLDLHGENFSCSDWTNATGPGKLVLSAPALHTGPNGSDIVTGFTFATH